jgi:(2Fe-2S) ferredoxin
MEPYRLHVYVCDQKKSEGVPCCSARGSVRVLEALRQQVAAAGLDDEVQITTCGSLGLCARGPNMVVYPEGVWYSGVQVEDVATIVQEHFKHGQPVERLLNADPKVLRKEITDNKRKAAAAFSARDAAGALPDDFQQKVRGFQPSRVLLTAIEMDVFSAVGPGARVDELARKMGTNRRATEMLLDALVALDVLGKMDGTATRGFQNAIWLRERETMRGRH